MKKVVCLAMAGLLLLLTNSVRAEEPPEVYWEDLVPEGFNELDAPPMSHDGEDDAATARCAGSAHL